MSLEKKYSTHCRAISMFLAAAITIGMVPTMTAPANAFDVNYTDDAVVIKKVDAFTGEPLKGAVFRFEGQTERVIEIPSYIEVETVVPDDQPLPRLQRPLRPQAAALSHSAGQEPPQLILMPLRLTVTCPRMKITTLLIQIQITRRISFGNSRSHQGLWMNMAETPARVQNWARAA